MTAAAIADPDADHAALNLPTPATVDRVPIHRGVIADSDRVATATPTRSHARTDGGRR